MVRSSIQKKARPATLEPAPFYQFPIEDAYGYPKAMPPARKIGLGRRALTGLVPRSNSDPAHFESSLERDLFVLLEFDPHVYFWEPQPVTLDVTNPADMRARRYTPDVLFGRRVRDAQADWSDQVTLAEVKYREQLKENWTELRPRLRAARRFASSQGWKFKIFTEREIRTPRLDNAKFLLPYADIVVDDHDELRVWNVVQELTLTTPNELLVALSDDRWERARLLTCLWRLIARYRIGIELSSPISMNAPIWPND